MSDTQFVSYAQNAEDVVLWRALGHIKDGRYIDVGANNPYTDSVTRAFYERGWRGITIEPLPDQAALQRRERPNDAQVEVAVSDADDGSVVLHAVPGSGLSSIVDEVGDRNRRDGRPVEDISVSTQTLTRILDDSHDRSDIHFMVIDIEGAEAQALAGLDLRKWRPWVMVVEATHPNSTEPSYGSWEHHLTDAGYVFCLFDGLSRFYVAKEHTDALAGSLSYPACVFDDYIPRRFAELRRENERLHDTERELIRWRHRALIEWSAIAAEAADSEGLARELKGIRESMSWRVTRPLRFARRAMGRLR